MDAMTRLDQTATETLVRWLAWRLDVNAPRVLHNRRRIWAGYSVGRAAILLGVCPTRVKTVVHEFAHHLDVARNGKEATAGRRSHSRSFYHCLRLVIAATGCVADYPWKSEYRQLQQWHEWTQNSAR